MLFDSAEVVEWLMRSGRGRNPSAGIDVAAFAHPPTGDFEAITALIALRAASEGPLSSRSLDEIVDVADSVDPDDEVLFREIAAQKDLTRIASYVDDLVDAAFGEAEAYERAIEMYRTEVSAELAESALTAKGTRLIARLVNALSMNPSLEPNTLSAIQIIDPTPAAHDVIAELCRDSIDVDVVRNPASDPSTDESSRRARRRLIAHRVERRSSVNEEAAGRPIRLVVMSHEASMVNVIDALSAVDDAAANLGVSELVLAVGPSEVLTDRGLADQADRLRSEILRSGRVRAIVRLPAGLRRGMSRKYLAIWVLSRADLTVGDTQQRVMSANLSTAKRDERFDADLIGDLVASVGSQESMRGHAFRFGRLVPTRQLLASREALVPRALNDPSLRSTVSPAEALLLIEQLLENLGWAQEAVRVEPPDPSNNVSASRSVTLDQRLRENHLRYLPGNRIPDQVIDRVPAGLGRMAVIGVEELAGNGRIGDRSVERSAVLREVPAARYTEPGDVAFITSPHPRAIVDREGLSIVEYPARILRIRPDGDDILTPDLITADINQRSAGEVAWRSWPSRGVNRRQRTHLLDALELIRVERQQVSNRLSDLERLQSALIDNVVGGHIRLTAASHATEQPE